MRHPLGTLFVAAVLASAVAGAGAAGPPPKPPKPPTDVSSSAGAPGSLTIAWKAPRDGSAPASYNVYRDGTLAGSTATTSYTIRSLACGSRYRVEVDSADSAGNRSKRAGDTVATNACPKKDDVAPRPPKDVSLTSTAVDSIGIQWKSSHDNKDKRDVTYGLYRDGALVDSTKDTSYVFRSLDCGKSYLLEVDAYDSSGNHSQRAGLTASTADCPPPATKPLSVAPDGSDFLWAHLAATYDGSTLRLYLNGAEVGTKAVGGAMAPSDGPLRIGGNDLWGEWFSGLVDDVRIYSRTLSAGEIATDMRTPVASAAPTGLVASYAFDEGSGATLHDLSGHGNDGTLNGATWSSQGHSGGALSFDGTDDYVTVADSNSLDLTDAMTLEAWVRASSLEPIWRNVVIKQQQNQLVYALYANNDLHTPSAHVFVGTDNEAPSNVPLPANPCASQPCASFDHAYHAAQPGQIVEVAGGSYPQQDLLFDASKTSADDVVFQPAAGASVTINGNLEAGDNRFQGGASHVTFRNMTVTDTVSIPGCGVPDGTACPPDALSPGNDLTLQGMRVKGTTAFYCASCSNVSLLGGTWGPDTYGCRAGQGSNHPEIQPAPTQVKRPHGILIDGTTWQNFARCTTDDHTECLQAEPADDLTIRNSIFKMCDTIAVNLANDLANSNSAAGYRAPNNVLIENNFFDEARDSTGGQTYYALNIRECTNCTIRYNSWSQAPRLPDGEIALNVKYIANVGPFIPWACPLAGVTFSHNVWEGASCSSTDKNVADVGFVNRAAADLHLVAGSPAIDAGDPASFPATDIDGDRRPIGAGPDAGADERR